MSAIQSVVALVEELGAATVDDLMPEMEGLTREQVIAAMQNARHLGLITCDGRGGRKRGPGGRGYRGSKPGTYRAVKKAQTHRPRVASVWDLAAVSA